MKQPIVFLCVLTLAGLNGCSRPGATVPGGESASDVQVLGGPGRQPGLFTKPRAVEFLSTGDIVVIDRSGRIQRLDATGKFVNQWRLPAWDNGTPTGFDVDTRDDSLWVADTHYQRILHYSPDGELLGLFGKRGLGPGEMLFPTDCAFDPDDFTLWVSEYGNRNRIIHYATDGEFLGEWGKIAETDDDLLRPQSLRVVPGGDLLVADAGHHRVWRFKRGRAPEPIGSWSRAGEEPGALKYPYSLSLGANDSVFVLEYGNSRCSLFRRDGSFLTTWGAPGHGRDQLYSPWGAAFDPKSGRLVIADTGNNRLLLLPAPAARPAAVAARGDDTKTPRDN